jgi:PAS domain-containing protein
VVAQQKSLVLILARELASNIATPMFVLDRDGTLVYYNEPAEAVAGQPYSAVGEISATEWGESYSPRGVDGSEVDLFTLPPGVALTKRKPAHGEMRVTLHDGSQRDIEITAFPLFAHHDEFVGAVAIFWDSPGDVGPAPQ